MKEYVVVPPALTSTRAVEGWVTRAHAYAYADSLPAKKAKTAGTKQAGKN
jgi:hypothetical protein